MQSCDRSRIDQPHRGPPHPRQRRMVLGGGRVPGSVPTSVGSGGAAMGIRCRQRVSLEHASVQQPTRRAGAAPAAKLRAGIITKTKPSLVPFDFSLYGNRIFRFVMIFLSSESCVSQNWGTCTDKKPGIPCGPGGTGCRLRRPQQSPEKQDQSGLRGGESEDGCAAGIPEKRTRLLPAGRAQGLLHKAVPAHACVCACARVCECTACVHLCACVVGACVCICVHVTTCMCVHA